MKHSGHASGAAVIGVTVAFTILAAMAVGLRLWARFAVSRNAGWDDGFIAFALFFTVATTTTMIIQVTEGMSRHQDTIGRAEGVTMLKAFYVSIWVYNLSLACTKLSILLQYLRIFPQKRFRIACYTLVGVVVVYSLYTSFTAVFACKPIAYFWDESRKGRCMDRFAIWFTNSGINIATDITTAVLPLPLLKQLELPRRQRKALMIVFALGGCTCIVSILRLQSLLVISQSTDVSYDNPLAAIWSSVEVNTAIICSCLPTLRCMCPSLLRSPLFFSSMSRDIESRPTPSARSKVVSSASVTGNFTCPGGQSDEMTGLEECWHAGCMQHVRGNNHGRKKKSGGHDDIELDDEMEMRTPFPNAIRVTMAIEQAVERNKPGGEESSSTRDLVSREGV